MAKRNTRILREHRDRAQANLDASLEDRSNPVEGKSWVYWRGAAEALTACLEEIGGTSG